jgi:hypothetical protein
MAWPKPLFNSFGHPDCASHPTKALSCGCPSTTRIGTRRLMVCSQSSPSSPAPTRRARAPFGWPMKRRGRVVPSRRVETPGTRHGLRSSCVSAAGCALIEGVATSRQCKCAADRDAVIARDNDASSLPPMISFCLRWARTLRRAKVPSRSSIADVDSRGLAA